MGESVGVPIEPDEQTRLLDACIQRAGVIGGGVPGGKSRSRLPVISQSNSDGLTIDKPEVTTQSGCWY